MIGGCSGSGKTISLCNRVKRLIQNGTSPKEILILAPIPATIKAIHANISNSSKLKITTIAEFCHSVLLSEHSMMVLSERDQRHIIREILLGAKGPRAQAKLPNESHERILNARVLSMLSKINHWTSNNIEPDGIYEKEFLHLYRLGKEARQGQDVSDLTNSVFKEMQLPDSNLRHRIKNLHIFVDDFQLGNAMERQLVKTMMRHANVTVTCDTDDFKLNSEGKNAWEELTSEKFDEKSPKIQQLDGNFRSSVKISDFAQDLIKNNPFPKVPNRSLSKRSGLPVVITRGFDIRQDVIDDISNLKMLNPSWKWHDFAILTRQPVKQDTHNFFHKSFQEAKIPMKVPGISPILRLRTTVRFLKAIEFLLNPNGTAAANWINLIFAGTRDDHWFLQSLCEKPDDMFTWLLDPKNLKLKYPAQAQEVYFQLENLKSLRNFLDQSHTLSEFLTAVESGLQIQLQVEFGKLVLSMNEKFLRNFDEIPKVRIQLKDLLAQLNLGNAETEYNTENAVTLTSYGNSAGNSWKCVMLYDVKDDKHNFESTQQERYQLYKAMTRAILNLRIYVREVLPASPLLLEIEPDKFVYQQKPLFQVEDPMGNQLETQLEDQVEDQVENQVESQGEDQSTLVEEEKVLEFPIIEPFKMKDFQVEAVVEEGPAWKWNSSENQWEEDAHSYYDSQEISEINLVTFNLNSLDPSETRIDKILKEIRVLNPTFIFFQEVTDFNLKKILQDENMRKYFSSQNPDSKDCVPMGMLTLSKILPSSIGKFQTNFPGDFPTCHQLVFKLNSRRIAFNNFQLVNLSTNPAVAKIQAELLGEFMHKKGYPDYFAAGDLNHVTSDDLLNIRDPQNNPVQILDTGTAFSHRSNIQSHVPTHLPTQSRPDRIFMRSKVWMLRLQHVVGKNLNLGSHLGLHASFKLR
eukprot:TRINITY_DN1372_c0_g4_i1.p1 TRINITY_DN1372_c0_g4~~TRINITY_DN1372_c0_g4_i1.p1  ORF type:complete len:967 (+),score=371.89 TRINITY_DN1372_c0_g4_i1:158-2902(+)